MNVRLTTTGRRSGEPRRATLYGWPDGDGVVIVGSYGGAEHGPHWVANLRAEPRAIMHANGTDTDVVAREVTDDAERERLWALVTDKFPRYATYQRLTSRMIPLFVLNPRR